MVKELKNVNVPVFDAQAFLDSAGVGRKVAEYRRSQMIYFQDDPATSVMYVQKGGVKLSVVDEIGKEAVLAIRGPEDCSILRQVDEQSLLGGRDCKSCSLS